MSESQPPGKLWRLAAPWLALPEQPWQLALGQALLLAQECWLGQGLGWMSVWEPHSAGQLRLQ